MAAATVKARESARQVEIWTKCLRVFQDSGDKAELNDGRDNHLAEKIVFGFLTGTGNVDPRNFPDKRNGRLYVVRRQDKISQYRGETHAHAEEQTERRPGGQDR